MKKFYLMIFSSFCLIPIIVSSKDCQRGGTLLLGTCICRNGYTGEYCEIELETFLNEKSSDTKINLIHELGSRSRKHFSRLKRNTKTVENSEENASGSELPPAESTDQPTIPLVTTQVEKEKISENVTELVCPSWQIPSPDLSGCIKVNLFSLTASINDIALLTKKQVEKMITKMFENTDIILFEATSIESVSSLVKGRVASNSSASFTAEDVSILLQEIVSNQDLIDSAIVSDFNECTHFSNVCGENQQCSNTDGSFKCICLPGYNKQNLSSSVEESHCLSVCDNFVCSNGGICQSGIANKPFCSCTNSSGNSICEMNLRPWKDATISLGVIAGFTLISFLIFGLFFSFRKQNKLPNTTGMTLPSGFTPPLNGDGRNIDSDTHPTTTTFRPDDLQDHSS